MREQALRSRLSTVSVSGSARSWSDVFRRLAGGVVGAGDI